MMLTNDRLFVEVQGFTSSPPAVSHFLSETITTANGDSALFAAKKKKKKGSANNKKSGGVSFGGFGGAAMEQCPCGSGETYSNCCSKVHKNVQNFRKATAEQIVRARYSAYARKLPEFLMMSTHPNNKAFNPDLRKWKEDIKLNMYDNFDLEKCVIVEEHYDDTNDEDTEVETASVKFIAEMVLRETGEKTSFMETSAFEKAQNSGAWLYLSGDIEAAPGTEESSDESEGEDLSVEEKLASQL
uniref:YchJ-like middle NTF2-like domain-containing protein n=1 Tax=Pseudo-nitzschia multistriata TaxID=183589 RepID=A0A448Z7K1_9STRA